MAESYTLVSKMPRVVRTTSHCPWRPNPKAHLCPWRKPKGIPSPGQSDRRERHPGLGANPPASGLEGVSKCSQAGNLRSGAARRCRRLIFFILIHPRHPANLLADSNIIFTTTGAT